VSHIDALELLVVETTSNDVEAMLNVLRNEGAALKSHRILDANALEAALDDKRWDLILCAIDVEQMSIASVVEAVARHGRDVPVIAIQRGSGEVARRQAIAALTAGAKDAVATQDPEHLRLVLSREADALETRRELSRWREALAEREQRWRTLLESSRDAVAYVHGGMHVHANPTYLDMFGYDSMDELAGLPVLDLVVPEDQGRFRDLMRGQMTGEPKELQVALGGLRSDGNRLDIKMELSPATFEGEDCWQVVIRDQSASNEVRAQLEYLKKHDSLTGLYNRQHFMNVLDSAVTADVDPGKALIYLELDNFNVLKESVGIGATDTLVTEIARMLLGRAPEASLVARFGDNVFTLLVDVTETRPARDVADELRAAIEERIVEMAGKSLTTTCSIGVCLIDGAIGAPESILGRAQHACRVARKKGGNRVEMGGADAEEKESASLHESGSKAVERAIRGNRLTLAFQPIVNLHEDSMEIYEVFVRAPGVGGEPIADVSAFVPELDTDLVSRLDAWVIRKVIDVMADREHAGHQTHFFIKLSDRAFADERMLLSIGKRLRSAQLSGGRLVFEISEASAMSQVKHVKAFLKGLKELECEAALEHFGTGLTSFNTLRHVPVQYLKIETGLVHTLATDKESRSAVRAIVEMARALKKRLVAVGVEDATTLAMLWDMGVHFAQGDGIQEASETLEWDFTGSEIS